VNFCSPGRKINSPQASGPWVQTHNLIHDINLSTQNPAEPGQLS